MCTDSCSMALRVPDLFSCACFHLHEIRKYFNCSSCWSRFNVDSIFYTYLWEEINSRLHTYPLHPPGSSVSHKFLARLDIHLTFVWVLTAVDFCIPPLHYIPWCNLNRPSFTQCDDLWIFLYPKWNGHPVLGTHWCLTKGMGERKAYIGSLKIMDSQKYLSNT